MYDDDIGWVSDKEAPLGHSGDVGGDGGYVGGSGAIL